MSPVQQPVGHSPAEQTHWPVLHSWPVAHAAQAAPPAPHWVSDSLAKGTHAWPAQQPKHGGPPAVHTTPDPELRPRARRRARDGARARTRPRARPPSPNRRAVPWRPVLCHHPSAGSHPAPEPARNRRRPPSLRPRRSTRLERLSLLSSRSPAPCRQPAPTRAPASGPSFEVDSAPPRASLSWSRIAPLRPRPPGALTLGSGREWGTTSEAARLAGARDLAVGRPTRSPRRLQRR